MLNVTLVDATAKKIEFVEHAIRELRLAGAVAVHGRAEDLAHREAFRETYDLAVARSVGSLSELAELLLPFLRIGGKAIALKPTDVDKEAAMSRFATSELGGSDFQLHEVGAPGESAPDALAVSRKLSLTPARFPRRVGVPHNRPLRSPRPAH